MVADGIHFPSRALEAALQFAQGFEKGLCLLTLQAATEEFTAAVTQFQTILHDRQVFQFASTTATLDEITALSERTETPMLFFEIASQGLLKNPKSLFKGLRELRVPFVLVKEDCPAINFSKVLVPVGFLPEEKEKGPYTANMGRFLHSECVLLQAKDYGSKASKNVESIRTLYDKFDLKYSVEIAHNDSFTLDKEAVSRASAEQAGMVVISTSRDYGLDDVFFGPKEWHTFRASTVPLMCINPRGDLYVLCW